MSNEKAALIEAVKKMQKIREAAKSLGKREEEKEETIGEGETE